MAPGKVKDIGERYNLTEAEVGYAERLIDAGAKVGEAVLQVRGERDGLYADRSFRPLSDDAKAELGVTDDEPVEDDADIEPVDEETEAELTAWAEAEVAAGTYPTAEDALLALVELGEGVSA